jgi:hypothetical protein
MSLLSQPPVAILRPAFRRSSSIFTFENVGVMVAALDVILIITASVLTGTTYQIVWLGRAGHLKGYVGIGANAALLFCSADEIPLIVSDPIVPRAGSEILNRAMGGVSA